MNDLPPKVFLDNCILSLSDTVEPAIMKKKVSWGGNNEIVDIHGYVKKPLPPENEKWKREQVICIPTIGKLGVLGEIELFKNIEIDFEGIKRPCSQRIGNAFENVTINDLDVAIERSYFFQTLAISDHLSNDQVTKFCDFLLKIKPKKIEELIKVVDKLSASMKENFLRIDRFKVICEGLSKKQYPDAFHLWSAEVNGMDIFLTTDKKFINAVTKSKKIDLPCYPMSPTELLNKLKKDVEPIDYIEGEFIDFLGIPHSKSKLI